MNTKSLINLVLAKVGAHGYDGLSVKASSFKHALRRLTGCTASQLDRITSEIKRQALVDVSVDSGEIHISLTPAGAHRLIKYQADSLVVKAQTNWDGRWRMVSFDIPKGKSAEKVYLYRRLRELGFFMMQKSLWVHPYPCHNVLRQITDYINLTRYMTFMEISQLDQQSSSRLLKHFSLPD